ncbi:hypothetical protein CYMTET_3115 [Cymbomonas tetramitiformis]|uniref:Uncharacterized protein n=1 Tax=Cymbomonas tetramitiformis TaxID=36881 RepID=A0AAE0LLQ2_9CHLO|nr:hypothetical protein CYMTET_3115 [Cymbomonas tetramitiformis]
MAAAEVQEAEQLNSHTLDPDPSSLCFTQQMAAAEAQEAEQLNSHSLDPDPVVGELLQSGERHTPDGAFPTSTTISDTSHRLTPNTLCRPQTLKTPM